MYTILRTEQIVELRTEEREPIIGSTLFVTSVKDSACGNIEGITANVSTSGACVYTSHKLKKGNRFTFYSKVFGGVPRDAKIIWCQEVNKGIFRAGISIS